MAGRLEDLERRAVPERQVLAQCQASVTAYSDTSKSDQVVAWINHYGKGRVFGTTLGHGRPTTDMESYHKLLANGLLWAYGQEKKSQITPS